jgi:isopentenyldiphosphate isomerase/intracellular septation protein A
MNRTDLLKKLLPGFLPLIVFIVVDSFLGTEMGILFAIGFGLVELVVIYLKEKRIDKFVIGDTLLLVFLGGISILLENDIFFLLKPALLELIFCILIGVSAFSKQNIVLKMGQRYMKGMEVNDAAMQNFGRSLKIMFWMFLVHVVLIVYSAYFMSKEAWAFISGGLFYILFGVYFVYELARNKLKSRKYANEEWFPLVDEEGRIIGKAPRSVCHSGSKLLHPVVHVHIYDDKKRLFLQKRSEYKKIQPGKWDTAVGGHISLGESLETGLKREVEEEVGLKNLQYEYITKYIWESEIEKELTHVFFAKKNGEIIVQPEEIDEGKFWTWKEIQNNIGKGIFTPNLEHELDKFSKVFLSKIK